MKVREIICKRWFLAKNVQAITLYPFIFFNGPQPEEVRRHEYVHITQIKRNKLGCLGFYLSYLYYSTVAGYYNNPYEQEARHK